MTNRFAVTITVTYTLHTQMTETNAKDMVREYWEECAGRVQGTVDDFEFIPISEES